MTHLMMDVSSGAPHFPVAASVVLGAGFLTAVILGSVAWYNSRRPVGWEDKERPDFVPEIKEE